MPFILTNTAKFRKKMCKFRSNGQILRLGLKFSGPQKTVDPSNYDYHVQVLGRQEDCRLAQAVHGASEDYETPSP